LLDFKGRPRLVFEAHDRFMRGRDIIAVLRANGAVIRNYSLKPLRESEYSLLYYFSIWRQAHRLALLQKAETNRLSDSGVEQADSNHFCGFYQLDALARCQKETLSLFLRSAAINYQD